MTCSNTRAMTRWIWTPDGMRENVYIGYLRAEEVAAALEAQAEEHKKDLSRIALQQEEYWSNACARIRREHAADLAEKQADRVKEINSLKAKHTAELAALRGEGEPALIQFENLCLIGEPCMIHRDYRPAMERLVNIAYDCQVKIWVTHSFRPLNAKLVDKIVEEAERSNHHAGSGIDMNPVYQDVWYTNEMMKDFVSLPLPIRNFLNAVTHSPDLRWGGTFGVNKDRVHIDSNLVLRDPAEWQRRVEQLRGERV